MNPIYAFVFIILCFNGNDAKNTKALKKLRSYSPEVQRAAYFAVFELQSQSGKYISLRNVNDAKKEVGIPSSPVDHDIAMNPFGLNSI